MGSRSTANSPRFFICCSPFVVLLFESLFAGWQVIQKMDHNRVSTEYWKSRTAGKIAEHSQPPSSNSGNLEINNVDACKGDQLPTGVDTELCSLLRKANPQELHSLLTIINDNKSSKDRDVAVRLLNDEIRRRPRWHILRRLYLCKPLLTLYIPESHVQLP